MDPDNSAIPRDQWLIKQRPCITAWKGWEDLSRLTQQHMAGNGKCEYYYSCPFIENERKRTEARQQAKRKIILESRQRRKKEANGRNRKAKPVQSLEDLELVRQKLLDSIRRAKQNAKPECLRQAAQQFAIDTMTKMEIGLGLKQAVDQTAKEFVNSQRTSNFFFFDEEWNKFEIEGARNAVDMIVKFAYMILGVRI